MRYLVLALTCAFLALPADGGRRRGNPEPVMVYFPVDPSVDPAETLLVQIPTRHGWRTVYELNQGECLRADRKIVGNATPYWIRSCWASAPDLCAEAVDGDGTITEADCLWIH